VQVDVVVADLERRRIENLRDAHDLMVTERLRCTRKWKVPQGECLDGSSK
jgi:hypothetical protein